jgi:hypothetical protein
VARGIGRSYTPNTRRARFPTIDPTAMPSMAGAISFPRPAIILAIGSSDSSSGTLSVRPSDVAMSSNKGR